MSFFTELKRRNVFRVAIAYLAGAWLLSEVATTLFPLFGFSDTPARIVVILLAIFFPLFLVFSWVFEFTPEGLKLEKNVQRETPITRKADKKLDRAIIVLLILAVGYFAVDKFVLEPGRVADIVEETAQQARSEALVESYGEKSIAVLPFVNMSSDPEQEYFSDGISEELLNLLSKIPDLRVIARTSSSSFRGKDVRVSDVARELNVGYVLEGSVRKAGNKLRITVQLIEAHSETHLWSKSYDRMLDDIFAIQDEIAAAVVSTLKLTLLGGAPKVKLVDAEAYALYLQARKLMNDFYWNLEIENMEQAIEYLKLAVEIDGNFSDAFVGLADAYSELSKYYSDLHTTSEENEAQALSKAACEKALKLAPRSSEAMRALGMITAAPRGKERAFRQSIELNPNNVAAHSQLGMLLLDRGALEEGAELIRKAHQLDPLNSKTIRWVGEVLVQEEKFKDASVFFRLASEHAALEGLESSDPWATRLEYLASLPAAPDNLDFEKNTQSWHLQRRCNDSYEFSNSDQSYSGKWSGYLASLPESLGWCNTRQTISAGAYLGKYIRMTGMIRTEKFLQPSSYAKLWLKIEGNQNYMLGFADGSPNYIWEDTDWTELDLRLYVPPDATVMSFGAVLVGKGRMWIDNFRLDAFDNPDFQ